jgi:uncharacterized protein with LGFP repeats
MSAIDDKYAQVIKANPWIGKPTEGGSCPDGIGQYQHYAGGASIYWTPATGTHLIYGLIRDKWAALGWEQGPTGYPMTDEANAGSGKGRYNDFQNGTIIWKSGTPEAFAAYGAIYGKWGQQKWDSGFLGFPTTDESATPDGIGRYNHFEGGSIYWTPETGAHIVTEAVRDAWAAQGWEVSRLQYPTTDTLVTAGTNGLGRYNHFEGGEILWTPQGGTVINLYPTMSIVKACAKHLGNDKLTISQIQVTFWNDGNWRFQVYLDDHSTFYGDAFAVGFIIDGDGHGASMSGTIGHGDSESRNIKGTDPWIEKFWHKVRYASTLTFRSRVQDDVGGVAGSLFHDLVKYAPQFIALAA